MKQYKSDDRTIRKVWLPKEIEKKLTEHFNFIIEYGDISLSEKLLVQWVFMGLFEEFKEKKR